MSRTWRGRRRMAALPLSAALVLAMGAAACTSGTPTPAPSATATGGASPSAASGSPSVAPTVTAGASAAAAGAQCPQVLDASTADFYPIQPSFSAGYTLAAQKLNDTTANWAYVVEGDFPYSYWMSWYLYDTKGVPLFKLADASIKPDPGSTNPFVTGEPILAPARRYHVYFMPSTTPASVVQSMEEAGKNVAVMPAMGTSEGVSLVMRSYWSLANDGLGEYDRFGYGGPTETPVHTITALLTDPTTGELTDTPVADCASQSQLPSPLRYDVAAKGPVITFEHADPPSDDQLADIPHFLLQTGAVGGILGSEFPPTPIADEVQFYRNVAANTPYADVAAAPPHGDPPDACGGYVMANLPNDVVSLVHIPQVPSFPDYRGATASTVNDSDTYDVKFYSVVIYGAEKQIDALGTVDNSQIGNRQIMIAPDGSATVVLYPRSATPDQVAAIDAVAKANGWNLLKSGLQTAKAPNLLVIREKGASADWPNALSPNDATAGAPCPQTSDPSLPLPQDPPSAQVTQANGMGLSAPQGVNCSIAAFLSGRCLDDLKGLLASTGSAWSASSKTGPTQIAP